MKIRPGKAERASGLLMGLMLFFSLVAVLGFGYTGIGLLPDWTDYLGLSLIILGTAVWVWGRRTLGRHFSPNVVIFQNHQLVEQGPYRLVRHPLYTGASLWFLGWGLMVQSWAALVVVALAVAVAIGYRIKVEERVLVSEFGDQYLSYSRRVKRLIPFIF